MDDRYVVPHFSSAAILTIDLQNDFCLPGAVAEIPGTSAVLPNVLRILEAGRAAGMPIIHVIRLYREDGSNVDLCRRQAVESGKRIVALHSPGADLVEPVKPRDGHPPDQRQFIFTCDRFPAWRQFEVRFEGGSPNPLGVPAPWVSPAVPVDVNPTAEVCGCIFRESAMKGCHWQRKRVIVSL